MCSNIKRALEVASRVLSSADAASLRRPSGFSSADRTDSRARSADCSSVAHISSRAVVAASSSSMSVSLAVLTVTPLFSRRARIDRTLVSALDRARIDLGKAEVDVDVTPAPLQQTFNDASSALVFFKTDKADCI